MDRSNVGTYKETVLRQSFVFNTGGPNNLQRSFINTSLASDSMAFGDDLRKYPILYSDPASKIYPIIKKPTSAKTFSSLSSSKPSKSNASPVKLKSFESNLKRANDNSSTLPITKSKSENLLKNVSPWNGKGKSIVKKWKNLTRFVRLFIMKIKCSNKDFPKWTSP